MGGQEWTLRKFILKRNDQLRSDDSEAKRKEIKDNNYRNFFLFDLR